MIAVRAWEYADPDIPTGSGDTVVMVKASTEIVSSFCTCCAGALLSVTRTVKVEVPVEFGLPLIVAPFRDIPAGSEPETIDHVYGVVPPEAVSV